jgi:hypothetical protein
MNFLAQSFSIPYNFKSKFMQIFSVVLIALACIGCLKGGQKSVLMNHPETIVKGAYGGIEERKLSVVENQADWIKLWTEIHQNQFPLPELPEINFKENIVVSAVMGIKNSGGYSIEIKNVVTEKDTLIVKITEISPGQECAVTLALTNPYHLVKVPKTGSFREVSYVFENEIDECKE